MSEIHISIQYFEISYCANPNLKFMNQWMNDLNCNKISEIKKKRSAENQKTRERKKRIIFDIDQITDSRNA